MMFYRRDGHVIEVQTGEVCLCFIYPVSPGVPKIRNKSMREHGMIKVVLHEAGVFSAQSAYICLSASSVTHFI
jgi:hypothetical protein